MEITIKNQWLNIAFKNGVKIEMPPLRGRGDNSVEYAVEYGAFYFTTTVMKKIRKAYSDAHGIGLKKIKVVYDLPIIVISL